jgi:tRNA dimethylallyltransferase
VPRSRSASSGSEPVRAVALVGPTASGKTAVGIRLARALGTEVIGCDSRQVYRRLDIGTAKPTPGERALARHHLVDVADPAERYSAGRYRSDVLALLPTLHADGRIPLFVGGTGLYLRAALDGLCAAPPAAADVRGWLGSLASSFPTGLHVLLSRVDPAAASRLHPNDRYRITRALEVFFLSGEPLSARHERHRTAEGALPAAIFGITLPPDELERRIRQRLEAMLAAGFLHEARALLAEGWDAGLPALRAVGYPQLFAHLRGETTLAEALEASRLATRQYARRQLVWFRAVPGIRWIDGGGGRNDAQIADEILATLAASGVPA